MKSVKKLTALLLAVIMMFSLAVSAFAYTDDAQIAQKEGVDILSYLGILEGSNGKFDPKGILTREQSSKIIAMFHNGSTNVKVDAKASLPFTDVAADSWAVSFIAYCYENKLVNGTSDTTFEPAAKLTGTAFCKMVLNVMGYDTVSEGFTGADWAKNVKAAAAKAGLSTGIAGFNADAPLSRENAAQIMLNALKGHAVTYQNGAASQVGDRLSEKWDLHPVNTAEISDGAQRPGHRWYKSSTGEQVGGTYLGAETNFVLNGKVTFHDLLQGLNISLENNAFVAFELCVNGALPGYYRDMCHFGDASNPHSGCSEVVASSGTTEVYWIGTTHVTTDYLDSDVNLYRVVITQ